MKREHSTLGRGLVCIRPTRFAVIAISLTASIALFPGYAAIAQTSLQLQSRTITPSKNTSTQFLQVLARSPTASLHALASFASHPTQEELKALSRRGVRVLSHFADTTYFASVDKGAAKLAMATVRPSVHFVALTPEDRVDARILSGRFQDFIVNPPDSKPFNYVLNPDGTLNLTVRFHSDTTAQIASRTLRQYARSIEKQSEEAWTIVLPRESLVKLAAEDSVRWIDAAPAPFLPENNNTRALIGVDALQNFNLATGQVQNLGGNGVQVGIFDSGVDETHADFGTRVILNAGGTHSHGTHVAGIVAGGGTLSNGVDNWGVNNGGAPFQWRGMAPQAQLIDAPSGGALNTATQLGYINNQGMDLSNHSYTVSTDGVYNNSNQTRDSLVRGDAVSAGNQIPARLQVYSAGNHGAQPFNGGNQVGYFALTKQMKNAVIVGNWNAAAARINAGSSLGPAHDGRIKPDVVAPGTTITAPGFCPSCTDPTGVNRPRQNYYLTQGGTSMASPAVAGSIAQLLQQYAATYGVNTDQAPPRPATLRGVIIHAATDIQAAAPWFNNPDGAVQPAAGPDFVTGWGLINAQGAANIIINRALLEDSITNTCNEHVYTFTVPTGTTGNVRVTLAWDDVAGNPALAVRARKLVNDLDLILIDPTGQIHFPWQLDQTMLDTFLNPVPNEQQQCGTAYFVQRRFLPVANPTWIAPGDPGNVNDAIPIGGVPVAIRGRDRLNNIEVVDAPAVEGTWQARVAGFNIPQGPQSYSLVGYQFQSFIRPPIRCRFNPWLCGKMPPPDFCQRYPQLCATKITFPDRGKLGFQFIDLREKITFPLNKICLYAIDCPACSAASRCVAYNLDVAKMSSPMTVEIFTEKGKLVTRDTTNALHKVLQFKGKIGEEYVVAFSPTKGMKLNKLEDVVLRVR